MTTGAARSLFAVASLAAATAVATGTARAASLDDERPDPSRLYLTGLTIGGNGTWSDVWDRTYDNAQVIQWLLAQKR